MSCRLYFANGILAYTSGPLLLLLMTLGLVQGLRGRVYEYQSGLLWLFLVPFLIMLLTPKLMGVLDTAPEPAGVAERRTPIRLGEG